LNLSSELALKVQHLLERKVNPQRPTLASAVKGVGQPTAEISSGLPVRDILGEEVNDTSIEGKAPSSEPILAQNADAQLVGEISSQIKSSPLEEPSDKQVELGDAADPLRCKTPNLARKREELTVQIGHIIDLMSHSHINLNLAKEPQIASVDSTLVQLLDKIERQIGVLQNTRATKCKVKKNVSDGVLL